MKNLLAVLAVGMLVACGGMPPPESDLPTMPGAPVRDSDMAADSQGSGGGTGDGPFNTNASALTCGAGTKVDNDQCVPLQEALRCGVGTVLVGDECHPDSSVCSVLPNYCSSNVDA
ncbi:MAG: hypothetical protein ACT4TC_11425 [Myxococcaceae bacterium]